jgi:gamma-glutamyl:cysteine ligase YbdK (ATP-grasp superfamily)
MEADEPNPGLHLFEGYGIELEYMIAHRDTLDVLPVADELLRAACGAYDEEIERGPLCWSNELILHVIEFKTNGPAPALDGVAEQFQDAVRQANDLLGPLNGRLMPSAMHPWMDPFTQARLWPHAYSEIYESYNRIFDCRGHGWANLQSMHINLPFQGDEEFARLHAAIRLLMPIMPALAASSPLADSRATGFHDTRLETYAHNADRIPTIAGDVIPEPVFSIDAYQQLLQRLYRDIAPFDPRGILQHEWLNSRGAIARFERGSIEIRVLDIQECPAADLAVAALICETLRALARQAWQPLAAQMCWPVWPLKSLLDDCVRRGQDAVIRNKEYLAQFGVLDTDIMSARALWRRLFEFTYDSAPPHMQAVLEPALHILEHGTLAGRILSAAGPAPAPDRLHAIYSRLCHCLEQGAMFNEKDI